MFSWKGLALFLTVFCVLAAIVGSTQARYPERFPDTAGGILNPAQNQSLDDDVSLCHGDDTDWCCEWDTDGTEGLLCTAADCDGLGGSCTAAHVYEDSGNLIADLKGIDSITNSSQKITVGPPGASSHSTSANQLHLTSTQIEIEGQLCIDYPITLLENVNHLFTYNNLSYGAFAVRYSTQTGHPMSMFVGGIAKYAILMSYADRNTSLGLTTPDDNSFAVQSEDATDGTKNSWLGWNRLALGGPGGGLGCINQTFAYDDMVDGGGASGTLVLDEGIPDGARVDQSILHSLTGFSGDTSAVITIGDGTDVDRYNTGTPSVFTTNASGCDLGMPSGTAWHDDAKNVTVTITSNADFTSVSAGEATISICYWTP